MRRYFFILAVIVVSGMGITASAEELLGRLFTTPDERAALDQLRKLGDHAPVVSGQPTAQAMPQPVADEITLDGYVARSGGRSTTWVNKIPHSEADLTQDVIVLQKPSSAPAIYLQTKSGKKIGVKVGETMDVHTQTVREVYEPGVVKFPITKTDKKP
jgi:hypothetical protein